MSVHGPKNCTILKISGYRNGFVYGTIKIQTFFKLVLIYFWSPKCLATEIAEMVNTSFV
jgi:hypothetical protein